MCNNIYSAKFARVLMKTNNKKSGLLYNHRVTDILLCNHLATVSYQSITGPTVDLNSFAKIQAKAKPSDLQERRRDSASTRPSASLATNSLQLHAISSIVSSSQQALSEITDSHTRVKKPVTEDHWTYAQRRKYTSMPHGSNPRIWRWQKQTALRKTAPAINTLIAKTCSNSRH